MWWRWKNEAVDLARDVLESRMNMKNAYITSQMTEVADRARKTAIKCIQLEQKVAILESKMGKLIKRKGKKK